MVSFSASDRYNGAVVTHASRETEIDWPRTADRKPIVAPGIYDLLVLRWRQTKPFWSRDGIEYCVKVVGGPYEVGGLYRGRTYEPPPNGYDKSDDVILSAHFNVQLVRGEIRFGPNSKLARSIRASFDGYPPDILTPDCLTRRRVSAVVVSVVSDSSKNPLHWSNQYSTADTFIGPGVGDFAEPLPF